MISRIDGLYILHLIETLYINVLQWHKIYFNCTLCFVLKLIFYMYVFKMAFSSCGNISLENKTLSDVDLNRSLEESTRSSQNMNCSDTDDEHKVVDKSFCESEDTNFHYEANGELVTPKKQGKSRGLAFLKRKWTVPEVLTTCALFFEVFGWVRILHICRWDLFVHIAIGANHTPHIL